jgi:hypothetical protein
MMKTGLVLTILGIFTLLFLVACGGGEAVVETVVLEEPTAAPFEAAPAEEPAAEATEVALAPPLSNRSLPPVRPHSTSTPRPASGSPPTLARIQLASGNELELTGPLTAAGEMPGFPPCPDLSLTNLKLANMQSMTRNPDGAIDLQTAEGILTLMPGNIWLAGEEDGVALSSVQQVNFEGSQPEVSLPTERVWQILLACGQQMKLGDLQIVADAGQEAIWGPYKLLLDLANLSSLVRPAESPETIEITDLNGETLIGVTFPPEAYAEGETVYGRLRFPWTDLYLAELLSKISPPTTKPPDVTWSLQTKDGQSIQVQDLHLTQAQLAPYTILDVPLEAFSVITPTQSGDLNVIAENWEGTLQLKGGELRGKFIAPTVDFSLPVDQLAGLEITGTIETLETTTEPIIGEVLATQGDSHTARALSFSGGQPPNSEHEVDPPEIENALLLDAGVFQYWVTPEWLRQQGFIVQRGLVSLPCLSQDLCPSGKADPETSLSFQEPPFSLTIPISQLKSFKPVMPPISISLDPNVILTIMGRDGISQQVPLADLQFARFPVEVWPGFTESWPYHWYLDPTLEISTTDGKIMMVDMSELASIEFPRPCQQSNCPVKLVYLDGSSLSGEIYPGSTNQDTQQGPSAWDANLTGLLGKITDGLQVFIPISTTSRITFSAP